MKALEITDLHKTYANGFVALKGIDLTVEEGEFFALLGPNGAGKSTTIGIIASLVRKSAGKVRVFGIDCDRDHAAAKALIGLVPQEINFSQFETPFQIVSNQGGFYGLPRRLAEERAETYLRQLGIWDKHDQPARNLSGGMKRRLMIARALVHEPKLLILDEPTAGVDIELRRTMWEFIRGINARGTTIILTTHYLEEAEALCRRIAIINHGRIIEDSSMRSLLARLHMETFVLDLFDPLDEPPDLSPYGCRLVDPQTLEVDVSRELDVNGLFVKLSERGIRVMSLRNKANRLEELFLHLLGEQLPREEAA